MMKTNSRKYVLLAVLFFTCMNLWSCATTSKVNQIEEQSKSHTKSLEQLKIDLMENDLRRQEIESQINLLTNSTKENSEKLTSLEGNLNTVTMENKNIVNSVTAMQEGIKQNNAAISAVKKQENKRKKIIKEHDKKMKKISKETAAKIKKLKEERAVTDNGKQ